MGLSPRLFTARTVRFIFPPSTSWAGLAMPANLVTPSGSCGARIQRLNALLPRMETKLLNLLTDWPGIRPIWTTPDRSAYISGPMNDEEAWIDLSQCVAGWLLRGTDLLTITLEGNLNNNDPSPSENRADWRQVRRPARGIRVASHRGHCCAAGLGFLFIFITLCLLTITNHLRMGYLSLHFGTSYLKFLNRKLVPYFP